MKTMKRGRNLKSRRAHTLLRFLQHQNAMRGWLWRGPFRALVRETMTLTKLFTDFRLWLMNWMTVVAVVLVSTSEVREVGERRAPLLGGLSDAFCAIYRYQKTKVGTISGERQKNGRETISGGTTTRSKEG